MRLSARVRSRSSKVKKKKKMKLKRLKKTMSILRFLKLK